MVKHILALAAMGLGIGLGVAGAPFLISVDAKLPVCKQQAQEHICSTCDNSVFSQPTHEDWYALSQSYFYEELDSVKGQMLACAQKIDYGSQGIHPKSKSVFQAY